MGTLDDDIQASNNAAPDAEQYGRPAAIDDPEAVRPPISTDNSDQSPAEYQYGPAVAPGDNSGAAPVMTGPSTGGDNSGAAPVMPAQQQAIQTDDQLGEPKGPLAPVGRGIKKLVSLLMGAEAAHPQVLDQAGAQVDPQGTLSPSDRNLLAVEAARQKGGDNAAWALLQANRVAYNAQTSFAKTALQGTPQKPADLQAAIDAANKAQANVLDGSNIHFAVGRGGITATVTPHGGAPEALTLTPQQFAQFLDVGGDGQWDKIVARSAPETLKRLAGANQAAPQAPKGATKISELRPLPKAPGQKAAGNAGNAGEDVGAKEVPAKSAFGETADELTPDGHKPWIPPRDGNYGNELENRAAAMFPSLGENKQRMEWMAAQEEKELARQNQVAVATEKGKWADKRALTTATGHVQAADVAGQHKENGWRFSSEEKLRVAMAKIDAAVRQEQARNGRSALAEAGKNIRAKMATGQTLDAADQDLLRKFGVAADQTISSQGQAPQPQRPAPAQQQAQPPQRSAAAAQGSPDRAAIEAEMRKRGLLK